MRDRLAALFSSFSSLRLMMLGDFFIDQYLHLDARLTEISLETGLEAYQVVKIQNSLGAAGTVANNLCAMGIQVEALTLRGDDANGIVMHALMDEQKIGTRGVVIKENLFTPTYGKPMLRERDVFIHELNRLDIKNGQPLSLSLERELIDRFFGLLPEVDGVLVTDQVQEKDCGVVTTEMRAALAKAAVQFRGLPIWVASRERAAKFHEIAIKTNQHEARKALKLPSGSSLDSLHLAIALHQQIQQPVLITAGEEGIAYCDHESNGQIPAVRVDPPLDVVGAGDSVMAAAVATICAGGSLREAAIVGCLAAAVTIKKIGTTGTACIKEMLDVFENYCQQYPSFSMDHLDRKA